MPMVVRLEGKVQGQDVIFKRIKGDDWETVIPASLNGVYVVELTAYDDFGNMSFMAKYILTVDLSCMSVKLEPFPWEVVASTDGFDAKCRVSDFIANIDCSWVSSVKMSDFYAEVRCCKC